MTELLDLDAIEMRCAAATPGPWAWITDRMNDRVSKRTQTGGRRALPGRRLRDLWVYLLAGPPRQGGDVKEWMDPWDFPHVIALPWASVKGTTVTGFPSKDDEAFIAAARTDVPALVSEVRRLSALVIDERVRRGVTDGQATTKGMTMQREPGVTFYKDGDHFATVTNTNEPDEFLTECSAALEVAIENHLGDVQFQLNGLLPQICEIWAKLKGYKADRVYEQRILIAGAPNPSAHMRPMNALRAAPVQDGLVVESGAAVVP